MIIFILTLPFLLSGCQTTKNSLYSWGGYQSDLYEYYYDPVGAAEFPAILEAHLKEIEKSDKKPAPGLYAEVGTFALQTGDIPKAIEFYNKESNAWSESKFLMQALVDNLKLQLPKEDK